MTENDITPEWAKATRANLGLSQMEFWAPAMASKAMASSYETGNANIPRKIKRLMHLHYVQGVGGGEQAVKAAIQLRQAAALAQAAHKGLLAAAKQLEKQ